MKLKTTYDDGAGGRYRWHDKNQLTGKVEAQCVQVGFRTEQDAVRHRVEYVAALQRPAPWYRHPVLYLVALSVGFLAGVLAATL